MKKIKRKYNKHINNKYMIQNKFKINKIKSIKSKYKN